MTTIATILKWIWDHPRWSALGLATVLLLVLGLVADGKNRRIDELKNTNAELATLNKSLKETLLDEQRQKLDIIEVLERKSTNERNRNEFALASTKAIAADKAAGDGALAPVLRNAAMRLRERQGEAR